MRTCRTGLCTFLFSSLLTFAGPKLRLDAASRPCT
jgi:hypothetical protein